MYVTNIKAPKYFKQILAYLIDKQTKHDINKGLQYPTFNNCTDRKLKKKRWT